MKILTKEVLTAFIADSNQSYIAGMLSDKIEGVSFYAEFIWDWIISHNFHKLEETVFIDDVLSYLKQAEEKGVTAYHISSFIE